MYRLTNRRLEKARAILDHHNAVLSEKSRIVAMKFDAELRECWDIGYQELKDIIEQMAGMPEYKYLAAYYMENINGDCVVSEFQPVLAELYGIDWFYSDDKDAKREAFWKQFEAEMKP